MVHVLTLKVLSRSPSRQGLTDHEIITQTTGLLTASHEATTLILLLCVYCLARNPESQTRLQEEIDSTFPEQVPAAARLALV